MLSPIMDLGKALSRCCESYEKITISHTLLAILTLRCPM